jgi:hypothetical protein
MMMAAPAGPPLERKTRNHMGLQIRVRHQLGERVIELPDRTVDAPLVVGRAATVEVQVPSVTVAPKHCVLFIHEGHWAVQDLGAGSGTFVNHEPVDGARFLQIGDVISVGGDSNAPTIEVDPAAAAEGRTGFAGTGLPQMAPVAPAYGAYAAPVAAPFAAPAYGYATPVAAAPQYAAAHAPGHYAAAGEHEHAPDDVMHFDSTPTVGYSSSPRRRKKSSTGAIVAVIAVGVAIIGGVIGYVGYADHRNKEVAATEAAAKKKAADEKAAAETAARNKKPEKNEVFVGLGDPGAERPAPKPPKPEFRPAPRVPIGGTIGSPPVNPPVSPVTPAVNPSTPTSTTNPPTTPKTPGAEEGMDPIKKPATTAPPEEGMDPIKKPGTPATPVAKVPAGRDPETLDPAAAASWEAMKNLAEQGGKESFAVLRFEDYKRMTPGAHDAEIEQFVDRKMDRIWWERIAQLMKKIDRLNVEMAKIKDELPDENNPDEKKKKMEAYKKMDGDKVLSNKTLREVMQFEGNEPPNLTNESDLTAMSSKRNKQAYETWKKITINYIKANQGRLSWSNDF